MSDPFYQSFRELLARTEEWLERNFAGASGRQAELRDSLRRYIRYCRRSPRKWRDKASAARSIEKIKRVTLELTVLKYRQDLRRD